MRWAWVTVLVWLLAAAVAGAQEPAPTVDYDPIGGFEQPDDSGFEALFWLMVPLALIGAFIGLRRDWHAGTFFGRSRVDLTNSPHDRPDLVIPTALSSKPEASPEERLREIARLKERGVITEEEHAKLRADVLADIADG